MAPEATVRRWQRNLGLSCAVAMPLAAAMLYYAVSPTLSAVRLADAMRSGDREAVADCIDLAALRRSVARQILMAVDGAATGVQRRFALQVGIEPVAAWLSPVLTVEAISRLLDGEVPEALRLPDKPAAAPARLDADAGLLRLWQRSRFQALGDYRLVTAGGGVETELRFSPARLSVTHGLVWRLSGIALPKPLLAAAVRDWRAAEAAS